MLHAATVLETCWCDALRLTCNVLIYATCGAVIDWLDSVPHFLLFLLWLPLSLPLLRWQFMGTARAKGRAKFSSPPDLWLQNFSSLFACNTLFPTEFGQRQRACPFNVAVKTEEKLFALFAQLKKQHEIIKVKFLFEKTKTVASTEATQGAWGRGTANQPVRM